MKAPLVDYLEYALLSLAVLLWVVALARGRALEWFIGPPQLPPWHISTSEFVAFVAAFAVAMGFVPLMAAAAFSLDLETKPAPARTTLVIAYATQLGWLAVALLLRIRPFLRPPAGPMRWHPALIAGLTSVLLALPAVATAQQVSHLLLPRFGVREELQDSVRYLREISSPGELFLWIGVVVVLAPLAEELVFRGVIYRYLGSRLPESMAVGLSAVGFAVLHLNAMSFLPLVVLGIALALAYRYTGRLITPIAMHAAFNLNTLVSVIFSRGA